jgi:hypothetical protein
VAYLASPFIPQGADPILYGSGMHVRGLLDISPGFQSDAIDAAYVVTDSGFQVDAEVIGAGGGAFATGIFQLPEPSEICILIVGSIAGLIRRRARKANTWPNATMESLEIRTQLTVPTPTGVSAILSDTGSATISWNSMGAGLSYSVERSTDGTTNWQAATASLLPPGTTTFTNPRMDAARAYYRVTDTDGTDSATSSAVQETVPTGISAPTFEAEAEALSAGGVRLKWELDPSLATQVTIFRKATTDSAWPTSELAAVSVSGSTGHYDDSTVAAGEAYEYRLTFSSQVKYVYAGNAKAAQHSRGVALLVIDESLVDSVGTSLQSDIDGFGNDLTGEGYQVVTRDVSRVDVPQTLPPDTSSTTIASFFGPWKNAVQDTKDTIRDVWDAYGTDLTNVILIGHVPVPYSGLNPADGHTEGNGEHQGAWPTDMYYATLSAADSSWTDTAPARSNAYYPANSNYPGDGKFDNDTAPALTDVAIGRIDFARTGWGVSLAVGDQPSDTEVASLQTYFAKNHQYRTGQWDVKQQALVQRNIALGFANYYDPTRLASNVGDANVKNGKVSARGGATDYSDHDLNNDTWLWAYAAAPGARYGVPNTIPVVYSHDYIQLDLTGDQQWLQGNDYLLASTGKHQSVFNAFFGSFIGDWDGNNSLLRTPLGESDGYGLAAFWGARPVWELHQMGLGGTIGESLQVTQNDRGTYTNDGFNGRITNSLMGDPTLRQDVMKPAGDVTAVSDPGGNVITWQASTETGIDGYYIYRATDPNGAWTRLNTSVTASTSYTDTTATSVDGYYYMVRADKLTVTPSGSYFNLSVGVVSQPVFVNKATAFDWDGHVPTTDNPWKQWIDIQLSQDVTFPNDPTSWLSISGQQWNGTGLSSMTLVYNTDFKLVGDPAVRTKRIVFLNHGTQAADLAPNGIWMLSISGDVKNSFGKSLNSGDRVLSFTFLIADANNDGAATFSDLVTVAQNYGQSVPSGDAPRIWGDLNADGMVDFYDLTLVAQLYGVNLLA